MPTAPVFYESAHLQMELIGLVNKSLSTIILFEEAVSYQLLFATQKRHKGMTINDLGVGS